MFPTGLHMLWEPGDAIEALRDRFGFEDLVEACRWLRTHLASSWDVEMESCERLMISGNQAIAWLHTDRGMLVAKWSREQAAFARLAAVSDLLATLRRRGQPVVAPLAARDGRRRAVLASGTVELSMVVQPVVVGEHLDVTDLAAVGAAGAVLAGLHAAMAGYADPRLTDPVSPRALAWSDRAAHRHPCTVAQQVRTEFPDLPELDAAPQVMHLDFRAANILTARSQVTAVLDFDEAGLDVCVNDLAHASVFLATLFTDWTPTSTSTRNALVAGYESVRPLDESERAWLPVLIRHKGIRAIPPGDDPAGWADAV